MKANDGSRATGAATGGGNAVYAMGLIGAAIFYIQHAAGLGGIVLAVLKAFVWPVFLVHGLLGRTG